MEKFLLDPKAPGAFSFDVMNKVVLNGIDFKLPDNIWHAIYFAFWNYCIVEVGYGGWPDFNSAVRSISKRFNKEYITFSIDKIETIVNVMFNWIEQASGATLDDSEVAAPHSREAIEVFWQEINKQNQLEMQELSAELDPAFNDTMTNFVYISDKLKEFYPGTYSRLTRQFDEMEIEWGEVKGTKDIWIRDYMPIQLSDDKFLVYKYEPDYLKGSGKKYLTDSQSIYKSVLPEETVKRVNLTLDGRNIVTCFWDRVMTDKVFQKNGWVKSDPEFIQHISFNSLNSPIIFLPWRGGNSNTPNADVHGYADCLVHWTGGNKVLMSNHREFYPDETDGIRWKLEVEGYEVTEILFDVPNPNKDFNWAYINYLEVGNKIIVPTFGIPEDEQALRYIKAANPDSIVRSFRMRDIARKGGAIHSITWNIKKSDFTIERERVIEAEWQKLSATDAPEFNDTMTNFVYISDKLKEFYPSTYLRLTRLFDEMGIEWGEVKGTKDIWIRDYMPIQLSADSFLVYKYDPDYLKDSGKEYLTDSQSIYKSILPERKVKHVNITLDGGNVVTCYSYRVIMDKVSQENSKFYNAELVDYIEKSFDSRILYLPWECNNPNDPYPDIYGHADGLIHWTGDNRVLMSNYRELDHEEAAEIRWRLEEYGFEVTEMLFDVPNPNKDYNWAYINYLEVGNKIIVPTFGIPEDEQALRYIKAANPDSIVRGFRMRDIAKNGRALHSITWNIRKSELPFEPEAQDPILPFESEAKDTILPF